MLRESKYRVSEADPLEEAARRGAQLILQRTLEAVMLGEGVRPNGAIFFEENARSEAWSGLCGATATDTRASGCTVPKGTIGLEVPQIRGSLDALRVGLAASEREAFQAIA